MKLEHFCTCQAPGGMINSHSFSSRAYFFDNPRRYDSDDDLSRSINSRADRARWVSVCVFQECRVQTANLRLWWLLINLPLLHLSVSSPPLPSWAHPHGTVPSSATGLWRRASHPPSSRHHRPQPPSCSPTETSRVITTTTTTTTPPRRTTTTTTTTTVTSTPRHRIITAGHKRISAPRRIKPSWMIEKDRLIANFLRFRRRFCFPGCIKAGTPEALLWIKLGSTWGPSATGKFCRD